MLTDREREWVEGIEKKKRGQTARGKAWDSYAFDLDTVLCLIGLVKQLDDELKNGATRFADAGRPALEEGER